MAADGVQRYARGENRSQESQKQKASGSRSNRFQIAQNARLPLPKTRLEVNGRSRSVSGTRDETSQPESGFQERLTNLELSQNPPQRLRDAYDTDVESFGDTTTTSLAAHDEDDDKGDDGDNEDTQDIHHDAPFNGRHMVENFVHPGETQQFEDFQKRLHSNSSAEISAFFGANSEFMQEESSAGPDEEALEPPSEKTLAKESANGFHRRELSRITCRNTTKHLRQNSWTTSRRKTSVCGHRTPMLSRHSEFTPMDPHQALPRTSLGMSRKQLPMGSGALPARPGDRNLFMGGELESEGQVESMEEESVNRGLSQESGGRERALELDYSSDWLASMSYADLAKEQFDHDPRATSNGLPKDQGAEPLAKKLSYLCNLPSSSSEEQPDPRYQFFSSLSIDDYEECGDIIVDQFAAILKRFKELRREKRKVAGDFEGQIAARQAAVQARQEVLQNDLGRLKEDGQKMVRRKG